MNLTTNLHPCYRLLSNETIVRIIQMNLKQILNVQEEFLLIQSCQTLFLNNRNSANSQYCKAYCGYFQHSIHLFKGKKIEKIDLYHHVLTTILSNLKHHSDTNVLERQFVLARKLVIPLVISREVIIFLIVFILNAKFT